MLNPTRSGNTFSCIGFVRLVPIFGGSAQRDLRPVHRLVDGDPRSAFALPAASKAAMLFFQQRFIARMPAGTAACRTTPPATAAREIPHGLMVGMAYQYRAPDPQVDPLFPHL